jgi:hypothetical protein
MQYHQMLKDKHEAEAKAAAEAARKKREMELKVQSEQQKIDDVKARELAAELRRNHPRKHFHLVVE